MHLFSWCQSPSSPIHVKDSVLLPTENTNNNHENNNDNTKKQLLDELSFQPQPALTLLANNDNNNLLGTALDPDGNVEVVFYDAHQYLEDCNSNTPTSVVQQLRGGAAWEPSASPKQQKQHPFLPPPPPPPTQLPLRFLRAGKNDPVEGLRRYEQTLAWRKENKVDTILQLPHPHFTLIQQNYWQCVHFTGHHGEPVFYEAPGRTNLANLKQAGVSVPELLEFYILVTEYLWQVVQPHDLGPRSIYILDLSGIRFQDFVGDVYQFCKAASQLCNFHYPERAGKVYCIHVPRWFDWIWKIVQPWIDPVTLEKIEIVRKSPQATGKILEQSIPLEHLPPEYGGTSTVPLRESPEELHLARWMKHNNELAVAANANGEQRLRSCGDPQCPFCTWKPVRSY